MIESRNVSVTQAVACGAWAVTALMFLIAAHIYATGGGRLAILVAEGACILSAGAATIQLKHYSERICRVVRDRDELADDIRRLQRVR